jgi:hypothetical protein
MAMRYLHQHPDQIHTFDSLSKAIGCPTTSLRKTINVDYPATFTVKTGDIWLADPIVWPLGRPFTLEPEDNSPIASHEMKPPDMNDRLLEIVEKFASPQAHSTKSTASKTPEDKFLVEKMTQQYYDEAMARIPQNMKDQYTQFHVDRGDRTKSKFRYDAMNFHKAMLINIMSATADDPAANIKDKYIK